MELDSRHNASVSIDGEAIRNIREEKRLTQLYVAKVVGVTTDTVSRWENNRYPTMRRDNAIRLAEALEVSLEDILKREVSAEDIEQTADIKSQKTLWPLYIIIGLLLLIGLYFYLNRTASPSVAIKADRLLPVYAAPGSRVLVRVNFESEMLLKGMILREDFPNGWKLIASEPPASGLDNVEGNARWIFRKPQKKMSVAYLLEVPKSASNGNYIQLHGELIANPDGQRSVTQVESDRQMEIQPIHWADRNGDHIIEDLEILDVSDTLEETGGLYLDWDLLELLWDAGGYLWDPEKAAFVPIK